MRDPETDPLLEMLTQIYGADKARLTHPKLTELLAGFNAPAPPPESSRHDTMLIAYPDHLRSADRTPLKTLADFSTKHLKALIDDIHVLPFYPYTSDDGFAVSDYMSVNSEFGSWQDLDELGQHFGLMYDGVFNHVSASHEWFQGFLNDDPRYRDYFIAMDEVVDVSTVTRPRTSPLLIAFDTAAGQKYVWATFSSDQLDLNYANPEVLLSIISIMLEYVRRGADLIRLDAIGYLWKEVGTSSIHLPRTHVIIRLLHAVLARTAPWVRLVTETNVPHHENITYFGNGRDEAQMVYNFALPPLLVHTMQTGDASVLSAWAATLDTPSNNTHFFNFTASHDGIGLLGAKRYLSPDQIDEMCQRVVERGGKLSMRTLASGKSSVYEMNIAYFDAVSESTVDENLRIDQSICSQAIALSLAGVPGIYLPSLFGIGNWQEGVELQGQNRAINRRKLHVSEITAQLNDPARRTGRVFGRYSHLLKIRAAEPAFDAAAHQIVQQKYGPGIFAVKRVSLDTNTTVFAVHNVTNKPQTVKLSKLHHDLITDRDFNDSVVLAPFQVAWLKPVKVRA